MVPCCPGSVGALTISWREGHRRGCLRSPSCSPSPRYRSSPPSTPAQKKKTYETIPQRSSIQVARQHFLYILLVLRMCPRRGLPAIVRWLRRPRGFSSLSLADGVLRAWQQFLAFGDKPLFPLAPLWILKYIKSPPRDQELLRSLLLYSCPLPFSLLNSFLLRHSTIPCPPIFLLACRRTPRLHSFTAPLSCLPVPKTSASRPLRSISRAR